MIEPHPNTTLAQASDAAKNGRIAEAESLLGGAIIESPQDADAHNLNFAIAMQRRDFSLARTRAEAALEHLPDNARALCNLGSALMQLGDHDGAMARFEAAIRIAPDYFIARRNRGILRVALSRFEEGAEDFKAALEIQPNHADTRVALADALTELRQFEAADTEIRTAAKLGNGSKINQAYAWGRLKYRMGKYPEARQAFAAVLSWDPNRMKHYEALAAASFHCGDTIHARDVTRAGVKRFPSITHSAGEPEMRVLVLQALGGDYFTEIGRREISYSPGNFIAFMPAGRISYTHVLTDTIDTLGDVVDLGQFDLAISNRSVHERIANRGQIERFDRLVAELPIPLVNPPSAVAQSTRAENARKFADAERFVFPRTVQFAHGTDVAATRDHILNELSLPLILRPLDTQLGHGARLVGDERDLERELAKSPYSNLYAIEYHDCVSEDGLFRRYRYACVGGTLAPENMHAGLGWNVHGKDRETLDWHDLGLDREELAFLSEPESVLGVPAQDLFKEITDNTALEIYGIDFGRRKDGKIVVFEVNASMSLTEADVEKFPYRRAGQEAMIARIEDYLFQKAAQ